MTQLEGKEEYRKRIEEGKKKKFREMKLPI